MLHHRLAEFGPESQDTLGIPRKIIRGQVEVFTKQRLPNPRLEGLRDLDALAPRGVNEEIRAAATKGCC